METISAGTQEEGNASSVKSEDSTPPHESGRSSPPPNCAICLGTCKNKCFTDSCLHQFCFKCLLTWSKVKAECPLCKQNFKSIIHNVRSNHQYEEYMVEQRETEESIDAITAATRRFRYRTTLTLPRQETIAIQRFLLHYPLVGGVYQPPPPPRVPLRYRQRSPNAFRRTVYRHNLWARPLPDFTGRFRDCSPDFYRYNDTQMHRLAPWISRELKYLLNENAGHITYVMARMMELLQQYHINSAEFNEAMQRYLGTRTEHFLHELYCYASTPYDLTGYDRNIQYTTDTRSSSVVNEIISSSDSEASVDSDIVMVSSSGPAEAPPGPSRQPALLRQPAFTLDCPHVIPIETISGSESDDSSSEVMLVGYIKPPQDRTPEVVDLLGSDSDVIVQESPSPAPAPLVKLSLSRPRPARALTDSDSDSYRPEPPRPRRKRRREPPSDSCSPGTSRASLRSSSSAESDYSGTTDDSSTSEDRRKRTTKRAKRKNGPQGSERDKKTSKKNSRSSRKDEPKMSQAEKNRKSKRKSHSGKGVKRSKKTETPVAPERDEAAASRPGPSAAGSERDRRRRRGSRDRRLKSVVSVMNCQKNSSDSSSSGNSNLLNILNSAILNPSSNVLAYNSDGGGRAEAAGAAGSARAASSCAGAAGSARAGSSCAGAAGSARAGSSCAGAAGSARALLRRADACFANSDSDPEDDLPLNLSLHKN